MKLTDVFYTEPAAKFFFEALISICKLGLNIKIFILDEQRLERALEWKHPLIVLPAPNPKS